MKVNIPLIFLSILAAYAAAGCSSDDTVKEARIEAKFTVADSIDSSGNYSGIGVTIIKKDSATASTDTLFSAKTDKKGLLSGMAKFSQRGQYALFISRNGQTLGQTGVILAEGDTVKISGELPGLGQTLAIHSNEHDALRTYQRVERNFQRVRAYAQAGRLTGDSLVTELQKWPDIYWQVYEENPETLAGGLSARRSIELLNKWDQPVMMEKVRQIKKDDNLVVLAAIYGAEYLAQTEGLDYSLAYLDTLKNETNNRQARMRIQMERINLMYDSVRVEQASAALQSFRDEYNHDSTAKEWAKSMTYDLEYLSPGDAIPEFSFKYKGKKVSRENMKGRPYLLEITPLSNRLYQQQFDRTVVIYNIYKNYNFEVITIPLDTSQVTVNAFFQERVKPWPVASANAFDVNALAKTFNIKNVPVRFLVDRQGRIAHRYIGREYENVIHGIQQIVNTN